MMVIGSSLQDNLYGAVGRSGYLPGPTPMQDGQTLSNIFTLRCWTSGHSLLPVSAGTNQSSKNDRAAARVASVQPGQERSLRKTSHAVAAFF
jgi:hypothetical protein